MRAFRFVHAADLHLDSPYKGLSGLPAAILDRIRESSFAALQRLVEIATEERVDFVLISGDVYDLADRSLRAQLRFQQAARTLSEHRIPLYVIHGNHDPLQGERAVLAWPESVRFFGGDAVETVIATDKAGVPVAQISGVSYLRAVTTDNWAARFPAPEQGLYAIAMLHANVDGAAGHDNYAPCTLDELVRSGYQYWALGHIHARRVLHEDPYVVYPGNVQGRSVKETGAKGCYVVRIDADGNTELTFRETSDVIWQLRELSIQNLSDEEQLKHEMEAAMGELRTEYPGKPIVVRFLLQGRGPLHRMLYNGTSLQELIDELRAEQAMLAETGGPGTGFVWIESCVNQTGAELELEAYLEQDSFIGDLFRLAESNLTDDAMLSDFYKEALAPLLQNPKAAKLLGDVKLEQYRQWLASARELAAAELLDDERRS